MVIQGKLILPLKLWKSEVYHNKKKVERNILSNPVYDFSTSCKTKDCHNHLPQKKDILFKTEDIFRFLS